MARGCVDGSPGLIRAHLLLEPIGPVLVGIVDDSDPAEAPTPQEAVPLPRIVLQRMDLLSSSLALASSVAFDSAGRGSSGKRESRFISGARHRRIAWQTVDMEERRRPATTWR
jgi:hypothetical protein